MKLEIGDLVKYKVEENEYFGPIIRYKVSKDGKVYEIDGESGVNEVTEENILDKYVPWKPRKKSS